MPHIGRNAPFNHNQLRLKKLVFTDMFVSWQLNEKTARAGTAST